MTYNPDKAHLIRVFFADATNCENVQGGNVHIYEGAVH